MKQKKVALMLIIILSILSIAGMCFASSIIKNTYKLEGNIISRILPETSLEEFASHIIENANIVIEEGTIGTGILATINENIYSLVVCGDTNGDGKITASDLSRIKNHILENSTLADLAFKAVDINEDGKITASELTKIKKYVLGLDVEFYEKDLSRYGWDETTDARKNVTTKPKLNFKVIALDKDGNTINDITWKVSKGTLDVSKGIEVNWTLPKEENVYKITAALSDGRVLEKEIKYIPIIPTGDEKLETIEKTYELDADEDGDSLTNGQEYELGTDILYDDTDADGINDYEEINVYGTDPLKEDTDEDEINDLNEILLELNPCDADSDGDGILDNQENITYSSSNEELGVNIEIKGQGNISDVIIDTIEINELDGVEAIISPIYNFSTNGELETARVEITYDENTIKDKEFNEKDLSLYYFNPSNYTFEQIETTIDTQSNTATATLNHFSMYLLANKNTMIESLNNQIMFVIDNSGSMYTYEQALEKNKDPNTTDEDLKGTPANDPGYKRLELVSNLIGKLDNNFQYGITKFTGSSTMLSGFGSSKEELNAALEKIKTEGENFDGTYIGAAIYSTTFEFSSDSAFNRYIVLISDGQDNAFSSDMIRSMAIQTAKEKGIKIITIGLGNEVNETELREYSSQTGGFYYHVDNAEMLYNLYASLHGKLNLERDTIINENGKEECLIVADSGFIPSVNGLPFANYRTSTSMVGNCYGIARLSKLYYTNKLNLVDSIERKWQTVLKGYNYDLSNLKSFKNNKSLGNYEFSSKAFEKLMTVTNDELYDYDKLDYDLEQGTENLHLEFKQQYKDYIEELEGVIKITNKTNTIDGYGEVSSDIIYIDIEAETEQILQQCPDLQLFKAIDFHYVSQYDEEGVDADISKKIKIDSENRLEELIDEINNGNPLIISYEVPNNGWLIDNIRLILNKSNHAVNAIQILRSIEKPDNYKIAIYNNNSPGEIEYLNLIKQKSIINGEISYKMFIDLESKQKTNIFFQY